MWQDPKTDWQPADTYDIETALSRVEGDLAEIVKISGIITPTPCKTQWRKTDMPTQAELQRINRNILAALEVLPVAAVSPPPPKIGDSFDSGIANAWERCLLWMWRALHYRPVLIESDGLTVRDSAGNSITVVGDKASAETYTSSYTGEVIDWFITQMEEWVNHG